MGKKILIDASRSEETRLAVLNGKELETYETEANTLVHVRGNIYLAKVSRVEPSLQAAFIEYDGRMRNGFLAFPEIHPDYYRIPVEDREKLLAEEAAEAAAAAAEEEAAEEEAEAKENAKDVSEEENSAETETVEEKDSSEDDFQEEEKKPRKNSGNLRKRYKIQEVVAGRQIMLIQVNKEERGNKGAALTTYLSLPGRYCVLMPNSPRGGGVSRKITSMKDRKKMKALLKDLDVPKGMSIILRTAGLERTKAEIKRDLDYLLRLWDDIRKKTLESIAPTAVYEEGNLAIRAVRDIYDKNVDEILVDGEETYRTVKDFMKLLIPSHAKKVQQYKETGIPLFLRYQVEKHLDTVHEPEVKLPSGGYLVINPTEALISIDVNSGKATKARNARETALTTNLEAAEEVAKQLRLRDLGGLVVIDFIDMDQKRHDIKVEKKLKEALKSDRARIEVGRISNFGLLEMSRQRLRPSLVETHYETCSHCEGRGVTRRMESAAMMALRAIEEEASRGRSSQITVQLQNAVALHLLNQNRDQLAAIETRYGIPVFIRVNDELRRDQIELSYQKGKPIKTSNNKPQKHKSSQAISQATQEAVVENSDTDTASDDEQEEKKPRRKRSRGGRGRGRKKTDEATSTENADGDVKADTPSVEKETSETKEIPEKKPRRPRKAKTEETSDVKAEEKPKAVKKAAAKPKPTAKPKAPAKAKPAAKAPAKDSDPAPANSNADAPEEPKKKGKGARWLKKILDV